MCFCGEDRIRTYEPVLPVTRFPGVPLQPLEHLSLVVSGCKSRKVLEMEEIFPDFFDAFGAKSC